MPNYQTTRFRFVEVAPQIYAAISPAQDMDITDAGLMDNFSNAGIILRGEGQVCDTCFDIPHARERLEKMDLTQYIDRPSAPSCLNHVGQKYVFRGQKEEISCGEN